MKKLKLVKKDLAPVEKAKGAKKDNATKSPKVKLSVWAIILIIGIIGITCILLFALFIIITSPEFDTEKLYSKESTTLYYADGSEMLKIGSEERVLVYYDDLPQVLIDAIVATEDSRFFQHTGLDVARFGKAFLGQLLGNDKAGGASTLSMQVIKKDYTSSESHGIEGIIRKFTDIYMAIFKLESKYTKEEIMEFYVNTMWFSGPTNKYVAKGIAGVELASQYFFGKSVSDLTLAEASILAGMFQNPTQYNPYTKTDNLRKRQNTVLKLMVQHGYITEQEKEDAQNIPIESLLISHEEEEDSPETNSAVVDYVLNQVRENTKKDPQSVPMKIYTTVDKKVQDILTQLEEGKLYPFDKKMEEKLQEGVAITSTENGSIVALSGGRNYNAGAKGTNRATDIRRQPGSTAKILFDYGPYIEYLQGSPYSMFLDEPTNYSTGKPINDSDRKFNGLMTMRTALSTSRNAPALRAFQAVNKADKNYIPNFVHSLGIDYGSTLYESASIGGFDGVSPLQMSAAYAAYGRGGYYIKPYIYTKIEFVQTGETVDYKYEKEQVMSEETAYMITSILMTAAQSGVGGVSVSGTDIAAKSGTTTIDATYSKEHNIPSNATNDAWNITYSPEYCVALWLGYDTTTSDSYLDINRGGTARKAIMKAVGSRVYSKNKKFEVPEGIVSATVELETFPAQLASEYTPESLKTTEIFKEGTEPTEVSTRFAKLSNPTNGDKKYNGSTLTLSWSPIKTPDAINNDYLTEFFNEYYDNHASKYYQARINYNSTYIGTLGYQIYFKDASNNLTYLGRTESNTYTVTNPANGTYIVKAAYSKFTANMSDGLEIRVNAIDENVENMVTPNNPGTDKDENKDTQQTQKPTINDTENELE